MNKTPVSILQEMMVKKCMVPNYELIHNGGGGHVNTFTYQVSCDGLSAMGTGRCKKDAKHEAAKAMLETIANVNSFPQLPASPAPSPKHTLFETQVPDVPKTTGSVPFHNAIGALQELCAENNLQEPRYDSISDIGPPHARVFTINCVVSTFTEEGVATTKKQAKHVAAGKMLHRLMDVVAGKAMDIGFHIKKENVVHDEEMDNVAKSLYPDLTKLPVIKKPNLGVKISEYHSQIKNTVDENVRAEVVENLVNLINDAKLRSNSEASYETMRKKFHDTLALIKIELEEITLSSIGGSGCVIGMSLDTSPALIEMSYAEDKTKASMGALIKIMKTLHTLLL